MNNQKLDAALAACATLSKCDASPEMVAFMARQADRRRKAEEGEQKCQALIDRAQVALRQAKKIGRSLTPGRASNALHDAKSAKASYSLAIGNMSNSIKYDEWMVHATQALSTAEASVSALEEDVRRAR